MKSKQSTRKNALAEFHLRITGKKNCTWQGDLHWIDKNQIQQFRSVLELLRLIDEAAPADYSIKTNHTV